METTHHDKGNVHRSDLWQLRRRMCAGTFQHALQRSQGRGDQGETRASFVSLPVSTLKKRQELCQPSVQTNLPVIFVLLKLINKVNC